MIPMHCKTTRSTNGILRLRIRSVLLGGLWLLLSGCQQSDSQTSKPSQPEVQIAASDPHLTAQIRTFCGSCHAVPLPSSFPKDDWYREVRRGYDFYYESGTTLNDVPVPADVVRWFQEQAPEQLQLAAPPKENSPVQFSMDRISTPKSLQREASVSFLSPAPIDDSPATLFVSLMKSGLVMQADTDGSNLKQVSTAALNPAAARQADLNGNHQTDLLIADLGSPMPADHDRGRILWIPDYRSSNETIPLLENIGRAADVRVADFDGDGDQDLIAAEFGWHQTGGLHLIRNDGLHLNPPRWSHERLDSRSGPIHVPTADLNGDGRMDFVSLISQEHEVIEAWMNFPDGFRRQQIYAAPDPSWGSSGIELCDIDADGDVDILYTNGDTFDSSLMKPYHGVWLLHNRGEMEFQPRRILTAPGVHRAVPADIDGDGLMDVVACAVLPVAAIQPESSVASLLWLQQNADGQFSAFSISDSMPTYATVFVGDIDGDEDVDIVAGCFEEAENRSDEVLHVFRNERLKRIAANR